MINKQQVKINQYWKFLGDKPDKPWRKSRRVSDLTTWLARFDFNKKYLPTINAMYIEYNNNYYYSLNDNLWKLTGIPCNKCNQYCFQDCKNG